MMGRFPRFGAMLLVAAGFLMPLQPAKADIFRFLDDSGQVKTISARLVSDHGRVLVLEEADGRWNLVPEPLLMKRIVDEDPTPFTGEQVLEQLEEEFGGEDSFRGYVDEPYVVGLILSHPLEKKNELRAKTFLKKAAAFMHNVEGVFVKFIKDMGIEPEPPRYPLVLLVFESDEDFEKFTQEETNGEGMSATSTAGYYSGLTNRLVIRMGECHTFETPLHEAVHQHVHNRGLIQRLSPVPAWFHEGLATGFENNGDRIGAGPLRVSARYGKMIMSTQILGWEDVVRSDAGFQGDILAGEAYAHAWGLHWFLASHYPDEYREYFRKQMAKEPFSRAEQADRMQEFLETFKRPIDALEREFPPALLSAYKKQRVPYKQGERDGVMVVRTGVAEVEMRAVLRADIGGVLQVAGRLKNISSIRPMSFHVIVKTETGTYADWHIDNLTTFRAVNLPKQVVQKVMPGAPGGPSQTFSVEVRCAVPESPTGLAWKEGKLPVPQFRRYAFPR